ncbi:GTPase activating protein [Microbotryomycetes sp. JL201]|nr:GTPase activating protein [Microbotryomycetes sp. JL201]
MGGGPASLSTEDVASFRTASSDDAVSVSHKRPTDPQSDVDGLGGPAASAPPPPSQRDSAARLLYSKSKVYLQPTSLLKDNIPGYVAIVQVGKRANRDFLLSWIPESLIVGTKDHEAYVLVELGSTAEASAARTAGDGSSGPGTPELQEALVTPPTLLPDHAFSVPIRSLYSLQVQPPTLAAWFGSVTLSVYGGESFGPLYFHDEESASTVLDRDRRVAALSALGAERRANNGHGSSSTTSTSVKIPPSWGGEALLSQLRLYSHLVRSQLEPSLFLVNPSRTDLEVHSTALFEDEAVPTEALKGVRLRVGDIDDISPEERARREAKRQSILHRSLPPSSSDFPDQVGPSMDNFTFNVLNSFSKITRGARSAAQAAAQSVLSHPLAKPILKNVPEPIAHFANAPGELTRLQETAGVGAYDGARVYLAKWARVVAEEGERARRAEVVVNGPSGRAEDSEVGAFEVLSSTYHITKPKSTRAYNTPIVDTEWAAWFDDSGKLMLDEAEAKKRIFQRGLASEVRKEVWPFLLNVYPWDSDTQQRRKIRQEKTQIYDKLKAKWSNDVELHKTDRFIEEAHRIEIDCRRTDRTHTMFAANDEGIDPKESPHPPSNAHIKQTQEILLTYVFASDERDYVQGMSDLLSPVYVVCDGDQVRSFWCFTTLMERMKKNFLRDQSGMKQQLSLLQGLIRTMDVQLYKHLELCGALNLFFCFRWILCGFKRELTFEQTLQLWEVLWTDYLGPDWHLFVALAIIEAHRDIIIRYLREFDEVLKYVTQLSGTLEIEGIMADAEVLYATFRQIVEASDQHQIESQRSNQDGAELRRRKGRTTSQDEQYPPVSSTAPPVPPKDDVEVIVEQLPEIEDELRALLV